MPNRLAPVSRRLGGLTPSPLFVGPKSGIHTRQRTQVGLATGPKLSLLGSQISLANPSTTLVCMLGGEQVLQTTPPPKTLKANVILIEDRLLSISIASYDD